VTPFASASPILDVTAGFGNEVTMLPPVPIVVLIPALPLSVLVFDPRGKGTIGLDTLKGALVDTVPAVCDWLFLDVVDVAVLELTGDKLTGS